MLLLNYLFTTHGREAISVLTKSRVEIHCILILLTLYQFPSSEDSVQTEHKEEERLTSFERNATYKSFPSNYNSQEGLTSGRAPFII